MKKKYQLKLLQLKFLGYERIGKKFFGVTRYGYIVEQIEKFAQNIQKKE